MVRFARPLVPDSSWTLRKLYADGKVYDDGDLVVWTDAATVKRINGTTGAVEFTKTVPYQIEGDRQPQPWLARPSAACW